MRLCFFATATMLLPLLSAGTASADLSKIQLREIDQVSYQVLQETKRLHDEFHEHLEGQKYGRQLDREISSLERLAQHVHKLAHDSDGRAEEEQHIRADAVEMLQRATRIERLIERAAPWARGYNAHTGINHMRRSVRNVLESGYRLDHFFPTDMKMIDKQALKALDYVKELHEEYHEHLEGYELSRNLDGALSALERFARHTHKIAHDSRGVIADVRHLKTDVRELEGRVREIDSLLDRQARIGVRARDYVGIEHLRDVMADVEASTRVMSSMLYKADPPRDDLHDNHVHRSRYHDPHSDRYRDRHYDRHGHSHDDH